MLSLSLISRVFSRRPLRAKFETYDTITLRKYCNVSQLGAYEELVLSGKAGVEEQLEAWEAIVERNDKENESFAYSGYRSLLKGYAEILIKHSRLKLMLIRLSVDYHPAYVEALNKMGYKINVGSNAGYSEDLTRNIKRTDSLITKIQMKRNEIERMSEAKGKGGNEDSFYKLLANLEMALGDGRNLPEDIKLAKYNVLKKLAKEKNKQQDGGNRK
jgi:hypothetical protein